MIGRMTTGAWSPFLKCGVGYLRLSVAGDGHAEPVSLVDRDGNSHDGQIATLPFYDEKKKIPRGLDTRIPERPE